MNYQNKKSIEELKSKKLFLLDMDGTIYLGDKLFDGTLEFLSEIKRRGARYAFMTNNSSKSCDAYIKKLKKLGIEAEKDDFVTSVNATTEYLLKKHKTDKIYVLGTHSFLEELEASGLNVTTEYSPDITCLCIAYDTELTYQKLIDASMLLTLKNVSYIATNPDYVCPTEWGSVPDCGSFCDMLYNATCRRPTVIGKPSPNMPLMALERYGVSPDDAVVVGDRLYTDVACGVNAGIDSVFVLSGEGVPADIEKMGIEPTFMLDNIVNLFN